MTHNYITVAPRNPKGKWQVVRSSAAETYHVVAECFSEDFARRICKSLINEPPLNTELTEAIVMRERVARHAKRKAA